MTVARFHSQTRSSQKDLERRAPSGADSRRINGDPLSVLASVGSLSLMRNGPSVITILSLHTSTRKRPWYCIDDGFYNDLPSCEKLAQVTLLPASIMHSINRSWWRKWKNSPPGKLISITVIGLIAIDGPWSVSTFLPVFVSAVRARIRTQINLIEIFAVINHYHLPWLIISSISGDVGRFRSRPRRISIETGW